MPSADGTSDFRSDTVTQPTPSMRQAMTEAVVGDDVYGDDPTVNQLEEEAAVVVGKERAVFVPSGTMANQLAINLHTSPGEEALCDDQAHLRNVERGASSALSGVGFRTVAAPGGQITPQQVTRALTLAGSLFPRIRLLVWENSHNLSGGQVIPLELMEETTQIARDAGLSVHLDGARIFNAALFLSVDPSRIAAVADTVSFCFSKGLGAPVGSVLCGPEPLIEEARYIRKRWGGAMRQVGVIAAPARIALAERDRLSEDHQLAAVLAQRLEDRFPGSVELDSVQTNMVNADVSRLPQPFTELQFRLSQQGIRTNPPFGQTWRLVTHRDVDRSDVDRLLASLSD